MNIGRMQRIFASAKAVSLIACLLFMVAAPGIAFAQSEAESGLGALLKQLDGVSGGLGESSGPVKTVSPVDAARAAAVKGIVRSPFSHPEGVGHPELNTRFTAKELFLIERFCRGLTNKRQNRTIRIVPEFSLVERDYCQRVSERIFQIGYHVFDGTLTPELLVNGAVGDDYVLGIGDQLVVTFEGKRQQSIKTNIDREGFFVEKDLGRIRAAGKTVGAFRRDLEKKTNNVQIGTRVFLSLGAVRQISVRVTGEVRKPGVHRVTGMSTLFDTLAVAGGINKTGSLRRVQVSRGDRIFWLDIYELLFSKFGGQDSVVRDGDHILVPPLGPTIAVSGDVKRAGIFELAEGENSISVKGAIELAGGLIRPRGNSLTKMSFDTAGRENITPVATNGTVINDGDIIVVKRRNNSTVGTVTVVGEVTNPGEKPLTAFPTVRDLLLSDNNFGRNPYLLFGVLETTDPSTYARRYFPINLQDIVEGRKNYALRDKDLLIVFGHDEIRYISSDDVRQTIAGVLDNVVERGEGAKVANTTEGGSILAGSLADGTQAKSGDIQDGLRLLDDLQGEDESEDTKTEEKGAGLQYNCLGLRNLATILQFSRSRRFASVVQALGGAGANVTVNPRECPPAFDSYPDLLPFVMEHSVAVNGEVRMPGAYPVVAGGSLASLLAVVGGMTLDVDTSRIEISRFQMEQVVRQNFDLSKFNISEITISPGDLVRFNPLFKARDTGPVLLSGEFVRPGLYDIGRGERLSEVIARAGGVTEQAFPYGAVFTRERVRVAQKAAFERAARELKSSAMYAAGKEGANAGTLIALRELTKEISNTESVGRVVIEADPTVLQVRPELDSVLEPGDKIYMPKRPNSVLVIGDILNPGALQFVAGTKVDQYVQQAGGMQISADEDRMFLVYPNGVAQPVSVSVWNYNPVRVPPGSTVVVPKDPAPVNILDFAKEMTTLLSQMAITAASLAVIGNN
jgi:polysaccharide biosynthesis/export protein